MYACYVEPCFELVCEEPTPEQCVQVAMKTFDGPEYPDMIYVHVYRLRRDGNRDRRFKGFLYCLDYRWFTAVRMN